MTQSTLSRRFHAILDFFNDREYYRRLLTIALPIALQNLIMSSLNMVGVMMIGQLGETSVAAVGLANQVFFLFQLMLFGITSGSAIFTAQLWGKRDIPNIRRVLGLCVSLALAISVFFVILAEVLPGRVLEVYSRDAAVIELGSNYLRIFGWAFLFTAVTFSYAAVLRSIGDVKTPLVVSTLALGFNTLLSYGLIFGKFGLPVLGVPGAATAALTARLLECALMLWLTYRRDSPAGASLRELLHLDLAFAGRVLKPILPVALNETLWSLGITTYNVVYARIGTEAIAAMNIVSTIENLAFVIFFGIGNACAVLVGNWIGASEERQAFRYAGRSLSLGVLGGLIIGVLILVFSPPILSLYKVSPVVIDYAQKVLTIDACLFWLRVSNLILFVGVFRSGGDTRFALLLDGVIIWVLGVPMALLGGFVLRLPVYWVFLMVLSEEFAKYSIGMWRYFSKKWIHNLAQTIQA